MAIGTTAAILGGVAIAGQTTASLIGAGKQQAAAEKSIEAQERARQKAMELAQASPGELAQIDRMLRLSEENFAMQMKYIQRDEELLNAVDPALREAGAQALQLLQGKEAAVLAPLKAERARQREALKDSLRQQLGAGYATSSAGIEALTRFDQESQAVTAATQQNVVQSFLGLSAQVRPDVAGKVGRAFGQTAEIAGVGLGAMQNIANRQVNAWNGARIDYNPLVQAAGGSERAIAGAFSGLGGLAGTIGGYNMQNDMLDKLIASRKSTNVSVGGLPTPTFSAAPAANPFTVPPPAHGPSLFPGGLK